MKAGTGKNFRTLKLVAAMAVSIASVAAVVPGSWAGFVDSENFRE